MAKAAGIVALTLVLAAATSAAGQARGSYRDSCKDVRQNGSMLRALCRNESGDLVPTAIDTSRCRDPIANTNGSLTCGAEGGRASTSRPNAGPAGEALGRSCQDVEQSGRTLRALCRDAQGNYVPNEIDLGTCKGAVANVNGRLTCGRPENGNNQDRQQRGSRP